MVPSEATSRAPRASSDRARTLAALAQGRRALSELTAELDGVLHALRSGGGAPDPGTPDRLRAAVRRAGAALCALPMT